MKFLTSTTYYLCWDVVIVAHVPWVLFVELPLSESYISCVCMVPSWTLVSVVFAGCCLSELPLSDNYVRELPLCLHGAIVDTCQRSVC